ncbi:hypothetical protein MRB53_013458 [Persea americana]|uniref:Uncharacterized protein n=1 Tax=Persea americana TaxID=3435 RepID=A0ACC2K8H2_PERAE|nr:hypothetical protein MRB53_013458 [Persea americana]
MTVSFLNVIPGMAPCKPSKGNICDLANDLHLLHNPLNRPAWLEITDPSQVLLFDVEEDYCEVFKLPNDLGEKCSHCFGECEGCLCYAYHNGFEMLVLMIDGRNTNEWALKHSINLDDIEFVDSDSETKKQLDILAFDPNLDAIFLRNRGHFFCYDFNSRALQSIVNREDPFDMLFRVFPFSECLRFLANANQNG